MQRHILQVFLSTLLALALSLAEAVAQTQPPCTPPPAPSNLTVTAASPTSISLAWNLPGPYTANYRIDVTDVTASINYPAIFTPATFVTISNLLSGHEHHIEVRAFYGPNCPLGPPAAANHATLTIIVDEIVGIQNCTPSNSNGIGIPQDRTACVGISGKKFPAADSEALWRCTWSAQSGSWRLRRDSGKDQDRNCSIPGYRCHPTGLCCSGSMPVDRHSAR